MRGLGEAGKGGGANRLLPREKTQFNGGYRGVFDYPLDAAGWTCYTKTMKHIITILAAMAVLAGGYTHYGDLRDDRTIEDSADSRAGTDGNAAAGCSSIKPT
jgi:hypothetical protein